jgi:hypothetical protein
MKQFTYGGIAVGVLDLLDAFVFYGLKGVSPIRILQSIAAGLLGRASFQGGFGAAALGLFLHFLIAFVIVAIYFAAARVIPLLTRRPFLFGPLYGLVAYGVMNYVVLPLSAAGGSHPAGAALTNGLLIHAFGVGLPAALAARAQFGDR